jgi:hypothetical protein
MSSPDCEFAATVLNMPPFRGDLYKDSSMSKSICGFLLFLATCLAYAQERTAPEAPTPMADPIVVIIFAILFFGGIAYFGWMVWRNERKRKTNGGSPE